MRRIGVIDVDGHHFPNLALMKIASYHKGVGDSVEWYNGLEWYDKVYMSKVFTFTPDEYRVIQADEVFKGGTGYRMYDDLFCDDVNPDYSLYPQYSSAYGFLTRGCIRKCPWCIVPQKEGSIRTYRNIEDVLQGRKEAILMDNNILASDHGIRQIEKIIDLKCKVDFNQGLDCRLVTDDIAKMLSKVKWIEYIRFSCDTIQSVDSVVKAITLLNKYGIKSRRIFIYILVKDVEDANIRCEIMNDYGAIPFAQPYRDFENNLDPTEEQKSFARYVNRKEIFKSTTWEKYNSRFKRVINA